MAVKTGYRADIDGLRAFAIVPVLLFHFGFQTFSGGFVGVDVFFVISGYLITRLIWNGMTDGTFSFSNFYIRRARRLFPALFVTVIVSLVAAYAWLPTSVLSDAMDSAIYALTSLSNVFFWSTSGYFDSDGLTKPFLHTWSLSVEEQFYIVWSLLLYALFTYARKFALIVVAGVGAISLIAAQIMLTRDPSGVFYLMPFRVIEFSLGAVLVWTERRLPLPRIVQEIGVIAGISLILATVFLFSEATPFPGLAAVVPCIGALLCIWCGQAPWFGRILSNRLCVGLGLISYSLYLVHWPIAVFFDAITFRTPELFESVAMLGATLITGFLMYRFVETPFRRPKADKAARPSTFGLVCALLAILAIVLSVSLERARTRVDVASIGMTMLTAPLVFLAPPASAQEFDPGTLDPLSSQDLGEWKKERSIFIRDCGAEAIPCGQKAEGKTNVLVLGDSLSVDALNILKTAFPEVNYVLLRASACAPWEPDRNGAACGEVNRVRNETIAALGPFDFYVLGVAFRQDRIEGMIDYLTGLFQEEKRVVVLGMGNHYKRPATDVYERLAAADDPRPSLAEFHISGNYLLDPVIRNVTEQFGGTFIDRRPFFCPEKPCRDYTLDWQNLVILDEIHQSWGASEEFGQYVRETYPDMFSLHASAPPVAEEQAVTETPSVTNEIAAMPLAGALAVDVAALRTSVRHGLTAFTTEGVDSSKRHFVDIQIEGLTTYEGFSNIPLSPTSPGVFREYRQVVVNAAVTSSARVVPTVALHLASLGESGQYLSELVSYGTAIELATTPEAPVEYATGGVIKEGASVTVLPYIQLRYTKGQLISLTLRLYSAELRVK